MQRITVSLGERDIAERHVLRQAYRDRSVISWQGFRVWVTAEVMLGPGATSGPYVYELRLDKPELAVGSVAVPA